ncbi:MAG: PPOX class F420-dependent oxidoreductase [Burkholderiales bacterium]
MANPVPKEYADLFGKKCFAHLATLMSNGQPQVTPVWCEYDGTHVLINTAAGRQKDKNMQRDARVTLCLVDPDNAYRYVEVRGRVAQRLLEGADAHIDKLSKKYLGQDKYPYRKAGEVRVIYKIAVDRASGMA